MGECEGDRAFLDGPERGSSHQQPEKAAGWKKRAADPFLIEPFQIVLAEVNTGEGGSRGWGKAADWLLAGCWADPPPRLLENPSGSMCGVKCGREPIRARMGRDFDQKNLPSRLSNRPCARLISPISHFTAASFWLRVLNTCCSPSSGGARLGVHFV